MLRAWDDRWVLEGWAGGMTVVGVSVEVTEGCKRVDVAVMTGYVG